jgi:hypothetical protein
MLRSFACLSIASLLAVACSDDVIVQSADSNVNGNEVAFTADVQPLSSFSYDTGLIPKGSPAQVQLKLGAGGGIKVEAVGVPSAKGLDGKKGGGKVAIDLHVKLDGRLKVDSMLKKIDDDLPGLKDLDLTIAGAQTFDPFLVGDGEKADVEAKIPATDLPPIPLGSTPGQLKLSVAEGSVLRSSFKGSCVGVSGGKATYNGELTTEGTIVLHGKLALDLPMPLNKEFDLGDITIPISGGTANLDFGGEKAAPGASDNQLGAKCEAPSASPATDKTNKPAKKPAKPKTEDQDGKHTTNPETGALCNAWTCEDYNGACGSHDDGCGGEISCGTCDPLNQEQQCKPTKCAELGATCGTHGDGCGGVLNCGACATNCATDAKEPNDTQAQATLLGGDSDTESKGLFAFEMEASDGDEDWFKLYVADRGFNGNPTVRVSATDKKLELSAFHQCDSLPNYSYCDGNGVQDNTIGRGCRAVGDVALSTDCKGINENGWAYVRVRKTVSDGTCHSYDLTVWAD